ncbi:hypothetical protein LZ30DRAFT_689516 [Colletotrichum cereale]|nr:hypothetical protein LZ30DRAFT_689516 [Colletotrichum cereale]
MATNHDHHRRSESSDGLVGEEKTFTCTYPGCERRFTRAEHMQRHALNHMPGGLSCDLCSAHFKRPDLLKRHMDRHRQKDLEAGGPGCGTLDTRKRSWKAPDGSVVEKRPCPNPSGRGQGGRGRTQPQQVPSPEPELNEEHSLSSLNPGGDQGGLGDSIPPDTQRHAAVLFCQSLCMSAFELRLELPCSQSIWEARDAASWASAWRSSLSDQRRFYLPTLKSYLTPSASRPSELTGFSLVLVLHGLMSVSWDMGRRDQTALGVVSQDSFGMGWRRLLSTAYDAWKSDFDAYCAGFSAPPGNTSQMHGQGGRGNDGDDSGRRVEFESFASAYKALYHAAQALLNMDFLDVQIYAGARHILGRPVQQRDYHRSAQVVKRWATSSDTQQKEHYSGARHDHRDADENRNSSKQSASDAAWHAALMLRETRGALNNTEAMNLFHVPWCLYLATLTCWAYHHARPSRGCRSSSRRSFDDFDDDAELEEDEMIWDPQGEMEALMTSMSDRADCSEVTLRRERKRTNGLVWIMADILTTVRWGIVHAGVVVLRGEVMQKQGIWKGEKGTVLPKAKCRTANYSYPWGAKQKLRQQEIYIIDLYDALLTYT